MMRDKINSSLRVDFEIADRVMLYIIFSHWLFASFVSSTTNSSFEFGFLSGGILVVMTGILFFVAKGELIFRLFSSVVLILFSTIFIQQHLGANEAHFHLFIALSILTIYKDKKPTLLALAVIIIHHFSFYYMQLYDIVFLDSKVTLFDTNSSLSILSIHIFLILSQAIITLYVIDTRTKGFISIIKAKFEYKELTQTLEQRVKDEIEDRMIKERKLIKQRTDSLTSLGNREKLIEDIEEASECMLSVIDIDRFKEVNEYYGHLTGDKIIIETSEIIKRKIGSNDVQLYRLAGDEFAILSQKISQDEFIKLNQSIVDEFENCIFKIDGNEFNITVTIGVAFERDNLYVKAEMAMKNGKERNLNINFYETSIDIQKKYENNIKWTKKLKDAIKEDRIIAFIQPIINNKTGKIEKYESLVRLRELDGKIEPPFHFLEIAKKARQYPSITQKVLDKSIDFFADKDLEFSINLTIEDILNKDTRCYIKDKLISHNIANRVVLEIVESEGIENFDEVSKFIIEMKSIGCKIAIDDFGTGYSNFEYLMKLNVDYVKIDGSMIKSLDTDTNSQIVIALIVEFAQKLNIKTIAEFVHSEAVYNKVKEMGIDYSQGYHLGRPESIDE